MLLFLLSSFRRLRTPLAVICLIVGLTRPGDSAVLSAPTLVNTVSACTSATLTWSDSGTSSYMLMLLLNGSPVAIQMASGTSATIFGLIPGNYTVMIEAIATSATDSSSGFSAPQPFVVSCGPVCTAPVVAVNPPSPAYLCHGHHGVASVVFSGTINSLCALSGAEYILTDTDGSPITGSLAVGSSNVFSLTLSLAAHPSSRIYTFSVQAKNSVGTSTSPSVSVGVKGDCDDGSGNWRGHRRHGDRDDD